MHFPSVLIIEDDPALLRGLKDNFESQAYRVHLARDGREGLSAALANPPDLLLLDIMLPKVNGYEICRAIRAKQLEMPIIMLTAKGQEEDIVRGLELGADDYVTKPFSPKELVARVRAVLRRSTATAAGGDVLHAAGVEVDIPRMRVAVDGRPVDLTSTEFQLLATLVREPGRVFTRGQLLDAVHGTAIESYERAIDAHVKNLRRKIEPTPGTPRYVLTVHGVGYRFADA
jgi:DNA-binding response OmpR family regulator